MAWMVLLACLPWWTGLPLLLALAVMQATRSPYLQPYANTLRRALRWGLVGLLVASYLAFDQRALGLILTMLAALVGFSLLVLLESWLGRRAQRNAALAATSPEWREMAMAPIGPAGTLIELSPPTWLPLDGDVPDIRMIDAHRCRIGADARIEQVEPQLSMAPGQRWLAMPMTAWQGVVLYDREHRKQYRLRGWQLYGWHAGEAWLNAMTISRRWRCRMCWARVCLGTPHLRDVTAAKPALRWRRCPSGMTVATKTALP